MRGFILPLLFGFFVGTSVTETSVVPVLLLGVFLVLSLNVVLVVPVKVFVVALLLVAGCLVVVGLVVWTETEKKRDITKYHETSFCTLY